MARMPNAEWKPLPNASSTRMTRYDMVILHTTVGSFEGTDGYFRRLTNGVNSHFLTGGYGEIRQLVDTAVRSGASGAGNHRSISVENADMGPGFPSWNTNNGADVPAFTPQQIEANANICAWANLQHGIPLVAADTSRPSARGIGYHRLGCNPWRVADGELWSSSTGKVCPGNRRIAQIPQIIARARQIVAELNGAPPAPAIQEDDMGHVDSISVDALKAIKEFVWRDPLPENQGAAILRLIALSDGMSALISRPGVDVDEAQIARELAPLLKLQIASLTQADLEGIAQVVNDEFARRQAS